MGSTGSLHRHKGNGKEALMPTSFGVDTWYTWAEVQQLRKRGKTFKIYGLKSSRWVDIQGPCTIEQMRREIREDGWFTDTPMSELLKMDGRTRVHVMYTQGGSGTGRIMLKGIRFSLADIETPEELESWRKASKDPDVRRAFEEAERARR